MKTGSILPFHKLSEPFIVPMTNIDNCTHSNKESPNVLRMPSLHHVHEAIAERQTGLWEKVKNNVRAKITGHNYDT